MNKYQINLHNHGASQFSLKLLKSSFLFPPSSRFSSSWSSNSFACNKDIEFMECFHQWTTLHVADYNKKPMGHNAHTGHLHRLFVELHVCPIWKFSSSALGKVPICMTLKVVTVSVVPMPTVPILRSYLKDRRLSLPMLSIQQINNE